MKIKKLRKELNKPKELMKQLTIRTGLREKLFYFYGDTFQDLYHILEIAEDLDYLLLMHSSSSMLAATPKKESITIRVHTNITFNSTVIIQEIIDDYWAAYLCFQNGFTKQAQGILRSTLELIIQIYYLRYSREEVSIEDDNWVSGKRGIKKIKEKIEAIKGLEILKNKSLSTRLDQMYERLCTATHSRKDRMSTFNMPRIVRAKDMPSFEPTEILYTKGLFFSVMDLQLCMMKQYLENGVKSEWVTPVLSIITEMIKRITKYQPTIQRFEKGYLVHREHAVISPGVQLLYSVNLDGRREYPSRKKLKLNEQQENRLDDVIKQRLLCDTP